MSFEKNHSVIYFQIFSKRQNHFRTVQRSTDVTGRIGRLLDRVRSPTQWSTAFEVARAQLDVVSILLAGRDSCGIIGGSIRYLCHL